MKLMMTEEVAEMLGISPRTLEGWRLRNMGPKFVRVGANVRYDMADVKRYLTERKSA